MGNKLFRKVILTNLNKSSKDPKEINKSNFSDLDMKIIRAFNLSDRANEIYNQEHNLLKSLLVDDVSIGQTYFDKKITLEDVVGYYKLKGNDFEVAGSEIIDDVYMLSRLALLTNTSNMPPEISVASAKDMILESVSKREILCGDYTDFLSYKVDLLLKESLFDDAEILVKKYALGNKDNLLGRIAFVKGDYEKAIPFLNRSDLIKAYLYSGHFKEAVELLNNPLDDLRDVNLDKVQKDFVFYYTALLKAQTELTEEDKKRYFDVNLRLERYGEIDLGLLNDSQILEVINKCAHPKKLFELLDEPGDDIIRTFFDKFYSQGDYEGVLLSIKKLGTTNESDFQKRVIAMYHLKKPLEDIIPFALQADNLPEEIKISLGDFEFGNQDYKNALYFYNSLDEYSNKNLSRLGVLQVYNGDFENGYETLKNLDLKKLDFDTRFAFLLSGFGLASSRIVDESEILEKVDSLFPKDEITDKVHQILGELYLKKNDVWRAKQHFGLGYAMAEDDEFKILNAKGLLEVFIQSKRYKKAKQFLARVNGKEDSGLIYLQSEIEMALNTENIDELVERYHKIADSEEGNKMRLLLVKAYVKNGDDEKAEKLLDEFVDEIPDYLYADSLDLAGYLLFKDDSIKTYVETGLKIHLGAEQNEALIPLVQKVGGNLKQKLYERLYEQIPDKYRNDYAKVLFDEGRFEQVLSLD